MASVLVSQLLLEVSGLFWCATREAAAAPEALSLETLSGLPPLGTASRVTSPSTSANRVTSACQGSGVSHEGHVVIVSSTGRPQDGQRGTSGF